MCSAVTGTCCPGRVRIRRFSTASRRHRASRTLDRHDHTARSTCSCPDERSARRSDRSRSHLRQHTITSHTRLATSMTTAPSGWKQSASPHFPQSFSSHRDDATQKPWGYVSPFLPFPYHSPLSLANNINDFS